jgi:hypothetical protein
MLSDDPQLDDYRPFKGEIMAFKPIHHKRPIKRNKGSLKKICAWCGKTLPGSILKATRGISHGICSSCAEQWKLEDQPDSHLNSFNGLFPPKSGLSCH